MWKILGGSATRQIKRSQAVVDAAHTFENWARDLPDEDMAQTLRQLDLKSSRSDLPKFLALVREAADRSIGLRPFDVQLLGALRMLAGDVVEMATGEGKTLSGAIAALGFSLRGNQVHVISVNDYLARRDAKWMGPLYQLLGFSVGWIHHGSTSHERRTAYEADITYASVNEIGFDVLRDQLCLDSDELIAPVPQVALIDEADSVLVDEALVPLILAGSTFGEIPQDEIIQSVKALEPGKHYETDSDRRNIFLTDAGAHALEAALGDIDLYSEAHVGTTLVQVNVALHAHVLLRRDVHYIVRDGGVHLINPSRGRIAELQRWPDGLQAAVEAKEGVKPTETGEVLDTITIQALIGRYPVVAGMTGTALAAGEQLRQFYSLSVSPIPLNRECIRVDEPDRVYDTEWNKNTAIIEFIRQVHATGQPVLIGTHNVAESEDLARRLAKANISAVVLNAKNDAEEAAIIAEAGGYGAVTVSTQMAGRGTDIKLGGSAGPDSAEHQKVVAAGGLCVIGTGRHHTQRLDDQLRGRAGRQGDPGRSVCFASWQDEVVTSFLPDEKLPHKHDDSGLITNNRVTHLMNHAQRVAEGVMLATHANTWRYNQLIAQQREIINERRSNVLRTEVALTELTGACPDRCAQLSQECSEETLKKSARLIMLYHLDRCWSEHLAYLADIRESIHLRALSRQNPLDEFHRMAIRGFKALASEAIKRAQETFNTATFSEEGVDLEVSGLKRPTSTWTYMVHDNPFSGDGGVLKGISSTFRI